MMNNSNRIFLTLLLCSLSEASWAKDDVQRLLKEMNAQLKDLKSQVTQSNARINELEKERLQYHVEQLQTVNKQEVNGKPNFVQPQPINPVVVDVPVSSENLSSKMPLPAAVTVGDVKGTFKIPGTETSLGMGGYIKADVLLNNVSAGRDRLGDQLFLPSQIPIGAAGEHSQVTFHAKESRLWLKSFTPSSFGDINTYVEIDFLGDAGTSTYTPRLRHAYGSMGNFLAGQTWTTFLNVSSLPDTLDAGGSSGAIGPLRQPLVRWTQPFSWAGTPMELQMALETPRSRLWVDPRFDSSNANAGAGATSPNTDAYFTSPNADRYPDLIARINFTPEWGNVSLATIGRQIRYTNNSGFQQETWGRAVNLSGKITTTGLDNIRFMTHYGNGDARYITASNTFADASLDMRGNLDLVTTYGAMFSYQHWWSKQWHSTAAYGLTQADQADYVNPVLNQQTQSVNANLLWSPINQAMFGVEYSYGNRELIDGRNGNLQRLQFSARYNF